MVSISGTLFDRVVRTLGRKYWDRDFRRDELPDLAAKFRAAAKRAESLAEECAVVDSLLSHVPSSHLALYSRKTYRRLIDQLGSRRRMTFGFQIKQRASHFFACKILEGGPADRAGVARGDRIVSIDGIAPQTSPRLDRRADDAYLDDAPIHALLLAERDRDAEAAAGSDEDDATRRRRAVDRLVLVVERRPGQRSEIVVDAARYSALNAAQVSARVVEDGGQRIGYVHFWYIHAGCVSLLKKLAKEGGMFADCDSMVLDLRGRGGDAMEAQRIVRFFTGRRPIWKRPFVVLMDKESRSAKEVLAYEFKQQGAALVFGEKSAGALVPATFADVGQGMMLMYPSFKLGDYSDNVELKGIEPDVKVTYPLAYTAGADPILEAALRHLAR